MTQQPTKPNIVQIYYELLGGHPSKFHNETIRRVTNFGFELKKKRDYTKLTKFKTKNNSMIIGQNLRLFSFCEHHLLPFFGIANIGYIPDGYVFGLSKLQRIVDRYASQPTIQEDLTEAICDAIQESITPKGIIVQLKAIHSCVVARGTQSTNAQFITTSLKGIFDHDSTARAEFFQSLQSNHTLKLL